MQTTYRARVRNEWRQIWSAPIRHDAGTLASLYGARMDFTPSWSGSYGWRTLPQPTSTGCRLLALWYRVSGSLQAIYRSL